MCCQQQGLYNTMLWHQLEYQTDVMTNHFCAISQKWYLSFDDWDLMCLLVLWDWIPSWLKFVQVFWSLIPSISCQQPVVYKQSSSWFEGLAWWSLIPSMTHWIDLLYEHHWCYYVMASIQTFLGIVKFLKSLGTTRVISDAFEGLASRCKLS